jgi:type IV fimbrial biogenesis protein FimT
MLLYSLKKSQGLTLLELLITLAIIVICLSIGVPSYNTFMANERFAVASNNLYNAYRFARNEAIKTSTAMTLDAKDDAWSNGWQVKNSTGEVFFESKTPHSSIAISGAAVTVKGMGSLSGGAVTFSISDSNKQNCLSVLSSGQSQLQEGACS